MYGTTRASFMIACVVLLAAMQNASAKVTFKATFEGGMKEMESIHTDGSGKVTSVANPAKGGSNPSSKVARFTTSGNSERAEVRVQRSSLGEYWYGWQTYLPPTWQPAKPKGGGGADIFAQWHRGAGVPDWAKGHPMTMAIGDDGVYGISHNHGGPNRVKKGGKYSGVNAWDDRGKWINWAFHVRWSKSSNGFMRVYHNGNKVYDYSGATWENISSSPMWKMGIYHGNPSTLAGGSYTIYGDNFYRGSSLEEVNPYLDAAGQDPDVDIPPRPDLNKEPVGEKAPEATYKIAGATASEDDGNGPENAIDGKLGTRWSAESDGAYLTLDLGEAKKVAMVGIAFYRGEGRPMKFDLHSSSDGDNFSPIKDGMESSGQTTAIEWFALDAPVTARYVRIIGHGNSLNAWNSITEVAISGAKSAPTSSIPVVYRAKKRPRSAFPARNRPADLRGRIMPRPVRTIASGVFTGTGAHRITTLYR